MHELERIFNRSFLYAPDQAGDGGGSASGDPNAELVQSLKDAQAEIARLKGELDQKDTIYKGLQTKYNNLNDAKTKLQVDLDTATGRVKELETDLATAASDKANLSGQIESLTQTNTDLESKAAANDRKSTMITLISDKFQNLLPMLGTLEAKDTPEATEQMLQGLSAGIAKSVQASVQAATAGYVPGGNFSHGSGGANATESADQLLQKAMSAAGTKEYDVLIERYFKTLDAAGQMPDVPMPASDGYGDIVPEA